MKRIFVALVALSLGFSGVALCAAEGDEKVDSRIFELRTYESAPGKMEALQGRFRHHVCKLFEKHHMTVIGFWSPTDVPAGTAKTHLSARIPQPGSSGQVLGGFSR